jgi:hypothetical protein
MSLINSKWLPPEILKQEVESQTANFNAATGKVYLVNPAGATLNVQLPAPALNTYIVVKDISGDVANKVTTLVRNATENIDGAAANLVITSNYQSITLVSDGTDWFRI